MKHTNRLRAEFSKENNRGMTREEAIRILNFGAWWDNLNPEMSDADSDPLFEALGMAIAALKQQQEQESKPLTQDEISKMAGKPVYCLELECYGIIEIETVGHYANKPFLVGAWHSELGVATIFEHDIKKKHYTLYRHKPKLEGQK